LRAGRGQSLDGCCFQRLPLVSCYTPQRLNMRDPSRKRTLDQSLLILKIVPHSCVCASLKKSSSWSLGTGVSRAFVALLNTRFVKCSLEICPSHSSFSFPRSRRMLVSFCSRFCFRGYSWTTCLCRLPAHYWQGTRAMRLNSSLTLPSLSAPRAAGARLPLQR
jgi:hypothetical protein